MIAIDQWSVSGLGIYLSKKIRDPDSISAAHFGGRLQLSVAWRITKWDLVLSRAPPDFKVTTAGSPSLYVVAPSGTHLTAITPKACHKNP